ncbi:hypothetical protein Prum_073770 [Phytohabitans rumicis]|uniref:Secreted protein n=1 Tax=Phytohabitans rumicis TaxID=1076125 RepID=A0A6V8LM74_9ACTN|nr:hypothetical protein Prum_073770 [Phytohabitans rumicis]
MKIVSRALTRTLFVVALIATGLGVAAAPASADSHLHYNLNSLTFTPVLRGQGASAGDAACQFRLRYGNFGNVAFAQLRVYAGGCGGYGVQVRAASGSVFRNWSNSGSPTAGTDGCGPYFEIQATSSAEVGDHEVSVRASALPNANFMITAVKTVAMWARG